MIRFTLLLNFFPLRPIAPGIMKRIFLMVLIAIFIISITSCVTMKRDCQGVKHVRLKNGIYI
jgi:hypothetical protein